MKPEQILEVARHLECGPPEAAVAFARMVAEHCAELVEELDHGPTGENAAAHIRLQFKI